MFNCTHLPLVLVNPVSIGSDNGFSLFGTKTLFKPMLGHFQLNLQEQTSVKFWSNCENFSVTKMQLKLSFAKWRPYYPGGGNETAARNV